MQVLFHSWHSTWSDERFSLLSITIANSQVDQRSSFTASQQVAQLVALITRLRLHNLCLRNRNFDFGCENDINSRSTSL